MITQTQTSFLVKEKAIQLVKDEFSKALAEKLHLSKISAPIIVQKHTGINDDLCGVERPVKFPIKSMGEESGEVVQSLAKWKRQILGKYDIPVGQGIWTDMRALRTDEILSPIHSLYVDQWDWEKHILPEHRNLQTLKTTVQKIYEAITEVEKLVEIQFPDLKSTLPKNITFIHSEELRQLYPDLTQKEREDRITKTHGAVFIIGIGGKLGDDKIHDDRAPDYDDWSSTSETGMKGLNGDILVWHPKLEKAFEISSMGIRVNAESLMHQCKLQEKTDRLKFPFHQMLLKDELPQSIGGGIGQSRLCMFMLKKHHIGEVQVSIWPETMRKTLAEQGIHLL
ncbi:aspartate--ammonia ligase [Psychroflexus aestuariivivens]|uniref:aspartate--ammonia ligase n=1 Tax=Psychroflexus aestuariivivens TaxID=1795040 RepID=UPI000FD82AF7|nr:aspartate--ammonia ligase [Psychroflexus aestuariivivens]